MNRDLNRRRRYLAGIAKRPKTLHCQWCQAKLPVKPRGRLPRFCCQTCRQRAYERRKWSRPTLVQAAVQDLAQAQLTAVVRAEIWSFLRQAGIVNGPPPATSTKPRRVPNLRQVR